jgi:hypothetical protein
MSGRHEIFLLDVDSVLVRPRGYREALRATVNHFGLRMNQPDGALSPTDAEIDAFEAHGFGCEWDSIPVCLATFFQQANTWGLHVWRHSLTSTLVVLARSGYEFARPDYAASVKAIAAAQPDGGKLAGHKARDYFLSNTDAARSQAVLRELFDDTAAIGTPTTRTFQHFTLGSRRFRQTYGIDPDFEVEPYLQTHDIPLLDDVGRAALKDAVEQGVRYAIFTARPSLPPDGIIPTGYAPEAEMAQALVGLEKALLVGSGHMTWLSRQTDAHPHAYVKPSPVQALTAIGAAWTGANMDEVLWSALDLAESRGLGGPLAALAGVPLRVTVFEDTPGGVRAVVDAGEVLRGVGLDVTVRAVGIADARVKREALAPIAAHVADDVNAGLRWALAN